MDLEAVSSSNMSKKRHQRVLFMKKRVVLGNVKHLGDKKDISLDRFELGNSVFSNVDSVSGNEESTNMTGINVESLLDSATNTSKAKHVNTGAIFGSLLGSPNFVMDDDNDVSLPPYLSISLEKKWIDPKIVKTQVKVSVKKSFALDINLSAMEENLTTAKTQLIRKIFSLVNSFGGAITPLKFEGIIRSIFTSEKSMNMAVSLAREREIVINTNLKKSGVHSDQAVVIKKIPINTPKKMIVATVAEFGNIKSIRIQLIVHMAKAVEDHDIWASRNHFRALLFILPVGTTAYDLGTLLDRAGGKTCIINRSLDTGNRFHCAVVGFESEKDLDSAFCTEPVFGSCGYFGHSALKCDAPIGSMPLSSLVKSFKDFVFEERRFQLAKLYKKKEVPISCPVAFGGKSWAQVVSVASLLFHGFLAGSSSNLFSSSYHDIGNVSSLNKHLASLECSFELFSDQVSTIVRHLNSAELVPLVSSSFVFPPDVSASSGSDSELNMVLDGTSMLSALSSSTVDVGVYVLSFSSFRTLTGKVGGLESKLASLEASIGLVLARLDGLCSSSGAFSHFFSK
ncbi:hypothetical protein G9A89_012986 [Geosiphon pyriformis]|nr:hypothetical protein G9A89_012986 [Geosiphon pyriformis]